MNRVINILTLLILVLYALVLMVVVYDLSISNLHLKGMPYQREIFSGMALLVLILGVIRIQRIWQGMRDMKHYRSFTFKTSVPRKHRTMGIIITTLEFVFMWAAIWFCSLFLNLEPLFVYPMIIVLAALSIERLLFIAKQMNAGPAFVLGLDDEVIAYFDREIHLFYYTGLLRSELYQKDLIHLGYRDDLNLSIETGVIDPAERMRFRDVLIEKLESKNVFVDDSLRNWQ